MSTDTASLRAPARTRAPGRSVPAVRWLRARPELGGVVVVAAVLNLWGLSVNGWANVFYSAAVRSMTTSWHDFLFVSLDKTGLMTVDKPPLSLWVEALSARIFGLNSLSILVPEALMGVAAAALAYDLVARRFGRPAGFAAGITLALTPITVAMSRDNNPDQLLILCCVAALWFALRALEDGRTRWLVWSGVCVGLGFETKMGVALFVVPGIALAYLWLAPRGRPAAVRQLLAGGAVMTVVGLAWPVLVTLTPAADRPWISGTTDNSIWSLIFNYNGLGRVTGQAGAPDTGGTGLTRLLQAGLGDQAGWLIGFAIVAGFALLVLSRLRRDDPRTGWLIAIGGAFATTAVVFSFAGGIFHPYYVSFLAPWVAMLVGAGVGLALAGGRSARIIAPLALIGGAITELVVLGTMPGYLSWATPLIVAAAAIGAALLAAGLPARVRAAVLGVSVAALLAAPGTWAAETIGHATNSTFPTGGPAGAANLSGAGGGGPGGFGRHGGFGGGRGGFGGRGGGFGGRGGGFGGPGAGSGGAGSAGGPPSSSGAGSTGSGVAATSGSSSGVRGLFSAPSGTTRSGGFGFGTGGFGAGGFGAGGAIFGGDSTALNDVISYVKSHGGGAIGVESQSTASSVILSANADVAGLGGFSGRESSVTAAWIAMQVRDGRLRWLFADGSQTLGGAGDSREGSAAAFAVAEKACTAVHLTQAEGGSVVYDCQGKASAILAAARTS